jgi:hypothetical protein
MNQRIQFPAAHPEVDADLLPVTPEDHFRQDIVDAIEEARENEEDGEYYGDDIWPATAVFTNPQMVDNLHQWWAQAKEELESLGWSVVLKTSAGEGGRTSIVLINRKPKETP